MAKETIVALANAISGVDQFVDNFDVGGPGSVKLYTGTKPLDVDTIPGAAVLLVTITLDDPAFGPGFDGTDQGSADLLTVPRTGTAVAAGTATWFRAASGAGTDLIDGTVGTITDFDMIIDNAVIALSQVVELQSWRINLPIKLGI